MGKSNRKGNRKRRENFPKRSPDLGYYFIVTDTAETEENYIRGFKESLPEELKGLIVVKVKQTRTDNLVEACRDAAALAPQYSEPWIVFDRDRVVGFDEIIRRAEDEGIHAGWSNPCIEIWFDAYFGKIHQHDNSVTCCRQFSDTFQKKTKLEYRKSNKKIYEVLNRYGDERRAISIAEQRLIQLEKDGLKKPSEMYSCTTLHRLIKEIREKTEKAVVLR